MKTLNLSLTRKWFVMERDGIKKEEYREIKPFYIRMFIKDESLKNEMLSRFANRYPNAKDDGSVLLRADTYVLKFSEQYDELEMHEAYPARTETDKWFFRKNPRIRIDYGKPEWGAEPNKSYFVITWEET